MPALLAVRGRRKSCRASRRRVLPSENREEPRQLAVSGAHRYRHFLLRGGVFPELPESASLGWSNEPGSCRLHDRRRLGFQRDWSSADVSARKEATPKKTFWRKSAFERGHCAGGHFILIRGSDDPLSHQPGFRCQTQSGNPVERGSGESACQRERQL